MANLHSKLLRIVAGVFALVTFALAAWLVWPIAFRSPTETQTEAFSGTLLLEQYECHRAETAGLIIRGVEDAYRPGDREVARFDRATPHRRVSVGYRNYDDFRPDAELFDYFELPQTTVSGLFVVRLAPPDTQHNDNLILGSQPDYTALGRNRGGQVFSERVEALANFPGWSRRADVYWVALEDVELQSGDTLVDFIRDPQSDGVVDLKITDDTVVDFAGIAYCSEPNNQTGLTFWVDPIVNRNDAAASAPETSHITSYIVASCVDGPATSASCEPFIGDTRCNRSVPLVCFRPDRYPFPNNAILPNHYNWLADGHWSAGELKLTRPVPGTQFETLADANAFCHAEFGDDWRVADFHLDAGGYRFWGVGHTSYSGRAWVDIRDQPYGTCWDR